MYVREYILRLSRNVLVVPVVRRRYIRGWSADNRLV